ncbi:MFS transporter [Paraburkholderia sp. BL10I2N1]|uniref:MFS transporter n=1 Tax=Paraburkholderia sp. BL10I2N1 TaxID=1938796 RepID=UPI00105D3FEB|nr:MFS transporter [Paraburkholderia sp. BL10I2N1]TDN59197.1 MFS transporter [Paraburkholderia sp. BL10I2N1]
MLADAPPQSSWREPLTEGRRRWFLLAVLMSAVAASSGITVIYTMLVTLYRVFPGSASVGWTVTVYWLGAAIFAAICGRLGDLLGYRRVLLIVLVIAAVGGVVAACAPSIAVLIAGCAMQSIASGITPLSMGLVRENLPARQIPSAVGLISAAGMVSAGLIYICAGVVVDHYSWQGGFWLKVALCAMTIAAVRCCVPKSHRRSGARIDFVRGLAFAPALCAILFAVQQVHAWGLQDPRIWGLVTASLVVLWLWTRHQRRVTVPLINIRLLAKRQVILANACMMCVAIGAMQLGQVFSLLLQQPAWTHAGFGLTATQAGFLMFTINIVAMVASPWSGRIATRYEARRAALMGMTMLVITWTSLILLHRSMLLFVPGAMLCSFGLAFAHTAVYNLIIEATPAEQTGEATGLLYVFFSCFFAVGAQAVFTLLQGASVSEGGASFPAAQSYVAVFGYVAGSALVGLVVAYALPKQGNPGRRSRVTDGGGLSGPARTR